MTAITATTPRQQHNFFHLYRDVFWWGVLAGSTLAFLPVFLARLNANSFEVGLLSAGPAIISLLFSMPAGRLLGNRDIVRSTFRTSLLHRAGYLLILPLPWLVNASGQVWATLGIVLVASVAGTFVAISFNAMFADLVAADFRPGVVGRRNALLSLSMTVATLLSGALLERLPFPANYQVVFLIGAIGAAMSSYHLGKLQPESEAPARVGRPIRDFTRQGWLMIGDAARGGNGLRYLARVGGRTLRLDLLRTPFGPFLAAYFIFYTFQYVAVPLFPVYFVKVLDLSDGIISLSTALFHLAMLASSMSLGWLNARFNAHRLLTTSLILYCTYPALMGIAHGNGMVLLASLLGGIVWGVANGGMVNALMANVPENDRPGHMALHNLALNLGILLGSFGGPLIAEGVGLRTTILIGAGLRVVAGVVIGLVGKKRD